MCITDEAVTAGRREAERLGMLNMSTQRMRKILEAATLAASSHQPQHHHHADRDLDRYVWRTRDDH